MKHPITIHEAVTEREIALFWEQLHLYHQRDIFPDPASEDLAYFLSPEYQAQLEALRDRPQDRLRCLFFRRDGQDVGFALAIIYNSEDGKCFLMEFCVYPEFRGGTGTQCAAAFLAWARANGASYAELNCDTDQRRRFWGRQGFVPNGADEWGVPLMLLPPEETHTVTVARLTDPADWQLLKLENGFLLEIGEETLSEERQTALQQAIKDEKIVFFLAKRGFRAVGMCSVSHCFSTFSCAETGIFDDFYLEPAFRGQGIARALVQAAQAWCQANSLASLTVTCAPCDEGMYQALGFDLRLGTTFASLLR